MDSINTEIDSQTTSELVAAAQGNMSRLQAFAIHLAISTLIFLGRAYLVLYQWYPDFFFDTDGGWEGMRIIVAVDLILGPCLTLIVFKAGKPGLKTDLAMIGVFQALCLAAGVYVVHSERPVALVYVDGQFNSMTSGSYLTANVALPDFSIISGPNPKRIQVNIPTSADGEVNLRREMIETARFMNLATDYYQDFDPTAANFIEAAYDQEEIVDRDQETHDIPRFLELHGGDLSDYRFYPLNTRYTYFFLGYRKDNNQFAGLLKTPGPI
jgi:hypothetical protein